MGSLGFPELILIFLIVMLLFGVRKRELGRNLGQGIKEFKGAMKEASADDQPAEKK